MEEQFILRVPPSVAERIERLLNENDSSEDNSLDLSFSEDGRTGSFSIGNDHFPASLLDLPGIVESYKTYDDSVLIKTSDIGQMIMVRDEGDPAPDIESRHGLAPSMRDARRRRFRREPDLNPEVVRRVEKDLLNIMAGGTAVENVDAEVAEQEEDGEENNNNASKKAAATNTTGNSTPAVAAGTTAKASDVHQETGTNAGEEDEEEPERSDSDDSDDSI